MSGLAVFIFALFFVHLMLFCRLICWESGIWPAKFLATSGPRPPIFHAPFPQHYLLSGRSCLAIGFLFSLFKKY